MVDMISLSSIAPFDHRTKLLLPNILPPSSSQSSSSHLPRSIIELVHKVIAINPTERLSCYLLHTLTSMMYSSEQSTYDAFVQSIVAPLHPSPLISLPAISSNVGSDTKLPVDIMTLINLNPATLPPSTSAHRVDPLVISPQPPVAMGDVFNSLVAVGFQATCDEPGAGSCPLSSFMVLYCF
jgi:hypothetical protein